MAEKKYIEVEAAISETRKPRLTDAELRRRLASIPAADVRPVVRGRWIDTDNYYQRWKCSVCGCHTRDAAPSFCPNCGAMMEKEVLLNEQSK